MSDLTRPPGGRYTEAWLRQLADAYGAACAAGPAPVEALAQQANVPVRTVHSWIYRARLAGIIDRAGQGRIGPYPGQPQPCPTCQGSGVTHPE